MLPLTRLWKGSQTHSFAFGIPMTALLLFVLMSPLTAHAADAAASTSSHLLTLSPIDLVIIVMYFVVVLGIGFYLKKFASTGEDFFMAGPQDDRLDRRPELHLGQPQFAGDDGLVGHGLPVRHARRPTPT